MVKIDNFSEFCLSTFMNSKSPVNCFVRNHHYFEKFEEEKNWDAPEKLLIGLCTIAPSSDQSLLTIHLPFEVILRRFEVVF